jgi:hypothetical protein
MAKRSFTAQIRYGAVQNTLAVMSLCRADSIVLAAQTDNGDT